MKVKLRPAKEQQLEICDIREEFIRLDALLKYAVVAETGGEAKQMIQDGEVTVNREVCPQRGKKIRTGDIVRAAGRVLTVRQRKEDSYEDR